LLVSNTIKNTTYTTGALVVSGGIGATGNLIANGSGQFQGFFDESSTVISAAIGVAGSGTPTPRFGFFNGTTSQNWQIDNNLGTFRWFTPGVSRMELNQYGILSVLSTNTSTSTTTGALVVSGGAGIAGNVFVGGTINTVAGTSTVAPIDMNSGTLLTTQNAGSFEYDGAAAYFTPDTTIGRGFIPATSTARLTAAGTAITSTTANFFGTTSNIPLVANAFYEIDIYAIGLKGSTAGTVTWTFTNTAAPTNMLVDYEQSPLSGQAAPPGSVTALTNINFRGTTTTTSATYNFTTGTLAASVNHYFRFKIFLQNGTGTSLKIQMSAGNGNASVTPQAGSVYFVRRLPGANTGSFAA
jgi:hypothetical protein